MAAGEAFEFDRGELPDQHPLRGAGELHDQLLLTEDNEVLEVE